MVGVGESQLEDTIVKVCDLDNAGLSTSTEVENPVERDLKTYAFFQSNFMLVCILLGLAVLQ